jgi:hypothetical protein
LFQQKNSRAFAEDQEPMSLSLDKGKIVGSSHGMRNELTRKKLLAEEDKKDL